MSTGCGSPAANVILNLYNSKGQVCISTTTDNRGIAQLNFAGSKSCTYPYYYLGTPSTNVVVTELFAVEAVSKPYPFYTNFQGYNYAIYAPQRATRYLLSLHAYYQTSTFTVIFPAANYPDVQPAYGSCCDIFLSVQKHPVKTDVTMVPATITINDKTNATIRLTDSATNQRMANVQATYNLTRTDPSPTTIATGTLTTSVNGAITLPLGKLSYGNYTLTITRAANATINSVRYPFNFTVYKAATTLVISPGWIQNAILGQTYVFTTSLVNNATQSLISVSGLTEQVFINNVLSSRTWFCTTSGCSWQNYFLSNPGGNSSFSWTPASAGQYQISATFPKQSYYTSSSVSITVSVSKRSVFLAVSSSSSQPGLGKSVTWVVIAYDLINNMSVISRPVSMLIDGSSINTVSTDSSGSASFSYSFPTPGSHNVTFLSAANQTYNSGTSYRPVRVFVNTSLSITGGTVYLGQQTSFSLSLKDSQGNPLQGTVSVDVNGAFYQNVTTDSSGNAQFTWRPDNSGGYTLSATFNPSSSTNYFSSTANLSVNVVLQTTINTSSSSSGTQSVSLTNAQGQSATKPPPSVQVLLPSVGQALVKLNGVQVASAGVSNSFGWSCVARVFGACVLSIPYWRVTVVAAENGILQASLSSDTLGSMSSRIVFSHDAPFDDLAFQAGLAASAVIAGTADAIILATLLTMAPDADTGAYEVAAPWVFTSLLLGATIAGAAGWVGYSDSGSRASFLEGLLSGPAFGAPEGLSLVEGLPAIAAEGLAIFAWAMFWGHLSASRFPPFGSPIATGFMAFGLFLYLLIAGTFVEGALSQ
jgi:hypothetical protein